MKTAVYLKGTLEPLFLNEPLNATMMNMNAGLNNNMKFFMAKDVDDHEVVISIPNVLFMRNEDE